jgi:hypothetical protein
MLCDMFVYLCTVLCLAYQSIAEISSLIQANAIFTVAVALCDRNIFWQG